FLNPDNVMPFKRVVDINETKEFPCSEIQRLYNWKLQHCYVLAECGGDFTPFKKFLLFVHVLFCQNQIMEVSFT
ncbi:MAG: acyl-CoA dehydrogenase, partial [Cyanobacteria bacterium P01_G01_bin.49]